MSVPSVPDDNGRHLEPKCILSLIFQLSLRASCESAYTCVIAFGELINHTYPFKLIRFPLYSSDSVIILVVVFLTLPTVPRLFSPTSLRAPGMTDTCSDKTSLIPLYPNIICFLASDRTPPPPLSPPPRAQSICLPALHLVSSSS